jgi:transporter family protein
VVLIFSWVIVFLTGAQKGISEISQRTLLFLVLSGMATGASWMCYFRALQIGDVNKVTPIDKSSTILTMILAFVLLGEPITVIKFVAMILMAVGTYMMIQKKGDSKYWKREEAMADLCPWIGSICKSYINSWESGDPECGFQSGNSDPDGLEYCLRHDHVFLTKRQDTIRQIDAKRWFFLVISGIATGSSWLCYYRALQTGPASVVVPIDKLSIVVTIAFSYVVFKEKLSIKSGAGLVLIIAGTMALLIPG